MIAEFYSKGSPLVSKETSLGRNQYLHQGGEKWSVARGDGSEMGQRVVRRGIEGGCS